MCTSKMANGVCEEVNFVKILHFNLTCKIACSKCSHIFSKPFHGYHTSYTSATDKTKEVSIQDLDERTMMWKNRKIERKKKEKVIHRQCICE